MSITNCTLFEGLSSKLFWLHQLTRWSLCCLADSSPPENGPVRVVSSVNFLELKGLISGDTAVCTQVRKAVKKDAASVRN